MNFRKTMMQEAMEQGLEKSLEKGLSQGLSQGLVNGQRDLLARMCGEKFKQLSAEELRRRLDAMNLTELGELGRRLLSAQTPDDLGLVG